MPPEVLTKRNVRVDRFLECTTFGPTLSSVKSFTQTLPVGGNSSAYNAAATAWVQEQMEVIPPTSHRECLRKRACPHLAKYVTKLSLLPHAYKAGSQSMRFALKLHDTGKDIHVWGEGPPSLLSIDGFPRTELTQLYGMS